MDNPRFEIPSEYDHADSFLPPQTEEEYRQFIEHQQPQIDAVAKMFDALKERTGQTEDGVILLEALAILDWATQEVLRGRVVLSADLDGSHPRKLNTPSIEHCQKQ